jgi:hypothetical protein
LSINRQFLKRGSVEAQAISRAIAVDELLIVGDNPWDNKGDRLANNKTKTRSISLSTASTTPLGWLRAGLERRSLDTTRQKSEALCLRE